MTICVSVPKEGLYPVTGSSTTIRIAAHKLERLITGSDYFLTTRLFTTNRVRVLEEMTTRFARWGWNHARISSYFYLLR
ncbi:MAG: hypothetical protein WCF90_08860 [Methanomicrobiales archaeon]